MCRSWLAAARAAAAFPKAGLCGPARAHAGAAGPDAGQHALHAGQRHVYAAPGGHARQPGHAEQPRGPPWPDVPPGQDAAGAPGHVPHVHGRAGGTGRAPPGRPHGRLHAQLPRAAQPKQLSRAEPAPPLTRALAPAQKLPGVPMNGYMGGLPRTALQSSAARTVTRGRTSAAPDEP